MGDLEAFGVVRVLSGAQARACARGGRLRSTWSLAPVLLVAPLLILPGFLNRSSTGDFLGAAALGAFIGLLILVVGSPIANQGRFDKVRPLGGLALLVRDWPERDDRAAELRAAVLVTGDEILTLGDDGYVVARAERPVIEFGVTKRLRQVRSLRVGDRTWYAIEVAR